ncbi:MAG: bifunctional 5,10-methylenetetrahydrofolate dehydrogenase/5,10-methenyltetrahydrofolate cyclohydrolase [Candidatus Rhabdochlamydia sp.]
MGRMTLLDGKLIAGQQLDQLKKKIANFRRAPSLAFILVGDHLASQTYVRMKNKQSALVGIASTVYQLPQTISEKELLAIITTLNEDASIDGILVQQPLPSHLSSQVITQAVSPHKDVDGFHPLNLGKILTSDPTGLIPCTPLGILHLLTAYDIPIQGKHVVILGRSLIVGKPLAALLAQKNPRANATVTLAHTATDNLSSLTRSADIVIAAMGAPHFVTASLVKEGAVVIDVGINRLEGKIVGDVHFEEVQKIASFITPVPGGIGPMTIAMLLSNTALAYQQTHEPDSLT